MENMMNPKKIIAIAILLLFSLFATACSGNQEEQVAVIVALTQTAAASAQQSVMPTTTNTPSQQVVSTSTTSAAVAQPSVTDTPPPYYGTINGSVSFPDDSVSSVWLYAVDTASSLWFKVALSKGGSETPYMLELSPGTYLLYAFPSGVGYSLDGKTLSTVTVTSGQSTSANLIAPTMTTCGPSFGVPAAPDGNFAAIAGAPESCISGSQQDYMPISTGDCSALNTELSSATGVQGGINPSVTFTDYVNSKSGTGCLISFSATGQTFSNFTGLSNPAENTLKNLGWQADMNYGAAGAGGIGMGYVKGNNLCLLSARSAPSDRALCPENQPIASCWEKLAPEQKIFTLTLNCAQATP
jgi:hypothetical protein